MMPADIAVTTVLALIILGPKRLPEIGKQLEQAVRELRDIADDITRRK